MRSRARRRGWWRARPWRGAPTRPGPLRAAHGFTLIELAVALALIGLLVTLVLPRLGLLGGVSLQASARQLASRIELLREDAALRGRWVRLSFDPQSGRYGAEVYVDTSSGGRFVPQDEPLFRTVALPDAVQMDVSGPGLTATQSGYLGALFSPDGYTDPMVVRLTNGPDDVYSIVVEPVRSRPRIIEGTVDVRAVASGNGSSGSTLGRGMSRSMR
ncbi:GspH/FimT family pseudopilin [Candidatus Binatia bacterium]|nr:GspH/FimT family pseudopilin [Candidatus Binatia bacterium]